MVKKSQKFQYVLYTIFEHGSNRLLDAIITVLLIRSLNVTSLGTFVVYQSWVAILLLLFPALENILYREYATLKQDGKLNHELGVFQKFNTVKIIFALFLALICSFVPGVDVGIDFRLAAIVLAFTLPLSQALYGIYREPLRFDLRQGVVFVVNLLQKFCFLGAIYVAATVSSGDIKFISPAVAVSAFLFGFVWMFSAKAKLSIKYKVVSFKKAIPRMKAILNDVVIWIHLNGAITAAIQSLDVYWISRAKTDLKEIALYSVALKAANFLQIIPMPFAQVFGVLLGRRLDRSNNKEARKLVWLATAVFATMAVLIVILGNLFSGPILEFLAKGKFNAEELARGQEYFYWHVLGIAILTLCYAQGAYINNRGNLKKMTMYVFIPWGIFSLVGYSIAASYGPMAAAKMNVPVYILCTLAHTIYFLRWKKNQK